MESPFAYLKSYSSQLDCYLAMNKIRNISKRTSIGFSLMKLVIVIVLIAIFASIAATRIDGLSTIRQQIAIDQGYSDIDLMGSMAFNMHDTMTFL